MQNKLRKCLALCLALVMCISLFPYSASAATVTIPKFQKTYKSLYENAASNGSYTYTLQNVTKGQTVQWSISGSGKKYAALKNAATKVTKKTVSNVVTIDTNDAVAAKNKTMRLTAKVCDEKGSVLYTVTASGKIKVRTKSISIEADDVLDADVLYTGETYTLGYTVTPANTTCKTVWTVTDAKGTDYSSYMTAAGVFKPLTEGAYKIKIASMVGTKIIKSDSVSVDVVNYMTSLKQTTVNQYEAVYSGDVSSTLKATDLTVSNTAGNAMKVKSLAFSADGKTVTVTMYSNFKDATTYSVSDNRKTMSFKASVGRPVSLELLTKEATVNKETAIAYALYDENGIDVSSVYPGKLEYTPEITNGYLTSDNKLFMTTVGKTATITVKYTNTADASLILKGTGVITCVAESVSTNTNFTLTSVTTDPDYTSSTYSDVRKASIGTTYYAHFRALDKDGNAINYNKISYQSSDPDSLIITSAGKVTPIKSGTVTIIVTAVYASEEYTYSYDVKVAEAGYLSAVMLDQTAVEMSNVASYDYKKYINVTAKDQYGDSLQLTNETVSVTEDSGKAVLATYDSSANQLIIRASSVTAGTYHYTLAVTVGARKATASFTVTVDNVPITGDYSYAIEMDKTSMDLALDSDTNGSKYVTLSLAQYRGGIFTNYVTYTSATITKGSNYYGEDLTAGGSATAAVLSASNRLYMKTLNLTSANVCTKAETGTYTIEIKYYSSVTKGYAIATANLTLTDSQSVPTVSIERTTSTATCTTALALAQNCLGVSDGTITDCVVTGETAAGSAVKVASGDQININRVTVTTTRTIAGSVSATVYYVIYVGKTLTNK